jgi:hypothetical protein
MFDRSECFTRKHSLGQPAEEDSEYLPKGVVVGVAGPCGTKLLSPASVVLGITGRRRVINKSAKNLQEGHKSWTFEPYNAVTGGKETNDEL